MEDNQGKQLYSWPQEYNFKLDLTLTLQPIPCLEWKLVKLLGIRVLVESALKQVKCHSNVILDLFRHMWAVNLIWVSQKKLDMQGGRDKKDLT